MLLASIRHCTTMSCCIAVSFPYGNASAANPPMSLTQLPLEISFLTLKVHNFHSCPQHCICIQCAAMNPRFLGQNRQLRYRIGFEFIEPPQLRKILILERFMGSHEQRDAAWGRCYQAGLCHSAQWWREQCHWDLLIGGFSRLTVHHLPTSLFLTGFFSSSPSHPFLLSPSTFHTPSPVSFTHSPPSA